MHWISVDDRLPTEHKEYVVFVDGELQIGCFSDDGLEYYMEGAWHKDKYLTHWIDIELPKTR